MPGLARPPGGAGDRSGSPSARAPSAGAGRLGRVRDSSIDWNATSVGVARAPLVSRTLQTFTGLIAWLAANSTRTGPGRWAAPRRPLAPR